MLSAYSNGGGLPDGYIASVAQVLSQFPREIVVQCCSPVHGIPKQCKQFRPNAGEINEWCEIRTESIWERAKQEQARLPPPKYDQATMAQRKAQVDRVLANLSERMKAEGSWWDRFSAADAAEIIRRNDHGIAWEAAEREARQQQIGDEDLI